MTLLVPFIALVFVLGLVAGKIAGSVITAPLLFTTLGFVLYWITPELHEAWLELLQEIAEIGLVLLLFTDASRTDLKILGRIGSLPTRLLAIGLPLTIVLGLGWSLTLFGNISFWEGAILAAIVAPTDAGLGQVVVESPRIPEKIRTALSVEAGLNDGLSVPFLLFFIAFAGAPSETSGMTLPRFLVEQLGYGTAIGGGIGLVLGYLLGQASKRGWTEDKWQQLGLVTLPLFCILASEEVAASMFIASFVAGLTVQLGFRDAGRHSVEFAEDWGELFSSLVFLVFGFLVARRVTEFTWAHALFALGSLTITRMLPVALALTRTGLSFPTKLFLGWFGPRGLASIVLGLVYLEKELHQPGEETIRLAVMATVFASIYAHGLSAHPGLEAYARSLEKLPGGAPELASNAPGKLSSDDS